MLRHSCGSLWLLIKGEASKGGLNGSTLACGPRDLSSNPAWGKLVWTNFINRKPYTHVITLYILNDIKPLVLYLAIRQSSRDKTLLPTNGKHQDSRVSIDGWYLMLHFTCHMTSVTSLLDGGWALNRHL